MKKRTYRGPARCPDCQLELRRQVTRANLPELREERERLSRIEAVSPPGDEEDDMRAPLLESVDDGIDDQDDDSIEDEEALAEALRPVRAFKPNHRQVKPTVSSAPAGPSPWERPREGFTATMTERVPEMRATKQAGYVKGTSREA